MFVDTNVLINYRIPGAPHYEFARARLDGAFENSEAVRISRQVLREYLAVLTRPQAWRMAVSREEALEDVSRMARRLPVLEDGPEVTEMFIRLCREVPVGGRQIHDANIVATMLAHGEHRLLTFNTSDFRRYGERIELV